MKTEPNRWGDVEERREGGKKKNKSMLTCIACLRAQFRLKDFRKCVVGFFF